MTLKWIRRWARFLDVKLRLDHTLSQSTDKLRSDNSLFQIVLIERGFVIQSRILLYIKETDGRPADGAIQSRIGWEEMEEDQGTPYALRAERNWRKTKYADAGRQNLSLNAWNEQRPWLRLRLLTAIWILSRKSSRLCKEKLTETRTDNES